MALLFAEHTVTIYALEEEADPVTKVVPIPSLGAGQQITCQISPAGHSDVLVDSKTGDVLVNPYFMDLEPEDIAKASYNALVVWEDTGDQFRITRKPQKALANGELADLNYGTAEMEQLEIGEEV